MLGGPEYLRRSMWSVCTVCTVWSVYSPDTPSRGGGGPVGEDREPALLLALAPGPPFRHRSAVGKGKAAPALSPPAEKSSNMSSSIVVSIPEEMCLLSVPWTLQVPVR